MSDSEVIAQSKTPSQNNEEVDIYSDVLSDQDSLISKLKEKLDKLSKEKELLLKSLSSLQKSYEELRTKYDGLEKKYNVVSFNSSALFKTAQAEIKRKDKVINDLRKEKDDLVFRKASVNEALQRARRSSFRSPKKYRSPMKRQNINRSNTVSKSTRLTKEPSEELEIVKPSTKRSPQELESSKPPSEELDNPLSTNVTPEDLECLRATKKHLEENEKETKSSKCTVQSKEIVNLIDDNISGTSKNGEVSNKTKPTPPPLKGPLTAYSKRLYKKIHGVSPQKTNSMLVEVNTGHDKGECSGKTEQKLPGNERETKSRIKNESKIERITSKLQKDVNEIIKLGSPSKTSPSATTKLSPEQHKLRVAPFKDKMPNQNSCKPEKLIIKCDLRTPSKDGYKKSPNTVSINETIDSILKNQRAGIYSPHQNNVVNNKKEKEPKKDNVGKSRVPIGKTGSRMLTNVSKKNADKLTISPATFGKLVTNSEKSKPNITPPSKTALDTSPIVPLAQYDSRKRKLSESSLSPNKVASQRPRRETYPEINKTNSFITSLFGESPLKSDLSNMKTTQLSPIENALESRTPSPIERGLNTNSPIFPDSPSLDSDNPEDLVIDTTACSQNTSPRVSESDKKEFLQMEKNEPVKVPFSLKNNSESQFLSQDVATKILVVGIESSTNLDNKSRTDGDATVKDTNKDQNNTSVINKKIDDDKQEKQESTLTLPLIVTSEEIIPQEGLCASGEEQNKLLVSNISRQPEAEEGNLISETSHSSASLDKVSSPGKSCVFQSMASNDDINTSKENFKEETPVARFIPSPPQLTLVSAFKHSENSVFALAEDTLGFVSALTRMRDISPIRTPDKKSKLFNRPLSQSQQSEPIDTECSSHKENEVSMNKSFEFLKPLGQGLQTNSNSPSVGPDEIGRSSICSKLNHSPPAEKLNSATSFSVNPSGKRDNEGSDSQKDSIQSNTSKSIHSSNDQSLQASISHQQEDIEKVLGLNSKITESNSNSTDVNSGIKPQPPKHNPFRRTKPVRLVSSENKIKSKLSAPSNMPSVQKSIMLLEHQDSTKTEVIPIQESVKEKEMTNRTNKGLGILVIDAYSADMSFNKKVVDSKDKDKISGDLKKDNGLAETTPNVTIKETITKYDKKSMQSVSVINGSNAFSTKDQVLPSIDSTKGDKVQTFKRSESLKMMQKPLPRNYLNVIGKPEAKKSDLMQLEVSTNKTRNCTEINHEGDSGNCKSNVIKSSSSELEQISHIANINKKLRVSKFQSKGDKENFDQSKLPKTVDICNKSLNDISEEKCRVQSSLVKESCGVSSQTMKENKKYKLDLISFNILHKNKRRNNRRSVSVGPEIRLGSNINLPPVHKSKQHVLTSNRVSKDSNNSLKDKTSESKIGTTSSCIEINKNDRRKFDDFLRTDRSNKESVCHQGNRTSTSNSVDREKIQRHRSKRSISSSPKRLSDNQKYDINKTPKVGKKYHVSRRSLSQSPECNKKFRSSYKVSPRRSPEVERRNHHTPQRSCSRSPEHNRSKSSYRHNSRRSGSGSRSRRRSRYDDFRRSPSPDCRRYRYHEKELHRRSSCFNRHRIARSRSRSRSVEEKYGKLYERSRHRSRNYTRRSRSNSSSPSNDRHSRNCSPSRPKSFSLKNNSSDLSKKHASGELVKSADHADEHIDSNISLSYIEEIEKMRKEIEILKGKVNTKENVSCTDSFSENVSVKEQDCDPRERRSPLVSATEPVELVKTRMFPKSDKLNGNARGGIEQVTASKTNFTASQNSSHAPNREISVKSKQNSKEGSTDKVQPTTLSQEERKPIQIKRKVRSLGDSEVQVVSIK